MRRCWVLILPVPVLLLLLADRPQSIRPRSRLYARTVPREPARRALHESASVSSRKGQAAPAARALLLERAYDLRTVAQTTEEFARLVRDIRTAVVSGSEKDAPTRLGVRHGSVEVHAARGVHAEIERLLADPERWGASGGPVLEFHDVKDLVAKIRDFPGQEISLVPSSYRPPEAGTEPAARFEADHLIEVIRATVAPRSWNRDRRDIQARNNVLVITATPRIQGRVRRFLADLSKARSAYIADFDVEISQGTAIGDPRPRRARLLAAAIDHFNLEEFDEAQVFAQQVLNGEPSNVVAQEIVEASRQARQEGADSALRSRWRETLARIEHTSLPTATLVRPTSD